MQDSKMREILKESKIIAVLGLSPEESKPSHKVAKFCKIKAMRFYPFILREAIFGGKSLCELKGSF